MDKEIVIDASDNLVELEPYEPTVEEIAELERQNQIGVAKVILAQTDHAILKACEKLLLQNSATQSVVQSGSLKGTTASTTSKPDVIDEVDDELADLIALRQAQRDLINELE